MISLAAQQALATAERLFDPGDVLATGPPGGTLNGLAGTALLHARLATLNPAHAEAAVRHWTAASATSRSRLTGIYSSPGGLAASLILGTPYLPDPERHWATTARATEWLSARAIDLADHHRAHLSAHGAGTPPHAYDAITGLAGIGRVLLAAIDSGHTAAEPGLLTALGFLTAMIHARHGTRPGWWHSADNPAGIRMHPSGAATTGTAHGIAGPLALLAVAHAHGHTVAGQRDAIREAADWLLHWRTTPDLDWPPYVSGDALHRDTPEPVAGRRDAWCYGTPGISRALTLTGHATGDTRFTNAANAALSHLAGRPTEQWDVDGPTLCHGFAGVLHAAAANRHPSAAPAAKAITTLFNPAHRFGFQHHANGSTSDNPGLLTGAAGIALTLADHGDLPVPAVPTDWGAILLLS